MHHHLTPIPCLSAFIVQYSAPSVTWLFVFRHVSGSLTKSSPTFCFDFQSFFWFQLSPAGTVWPVHCQTLPRVYHIAANCFDAGWVAWRRFIRGFQQTTAACWVWKEQGEETAAIRSKGKSRKMLQWFWELRKDTTRIKILLVLILELSIFIMCVYTATVCGACNSLTAAVSCTHWSGISAWGDPPHPHCPKPTSLAGKKNGKKLFFSLRHRCPEWLQLTGLYSFHCEPIIAVMLISLFNYPAGSHGRAIIKRKSAKMNRVRVPRLNTVTSALWEYTWELDSG